MMPLELAIATTGGVLLVVGLWPRPKSLVLFTLTFVLFSRSLVHLTGIEQLELVDDGLVLLILCRAIVERLSSPHKRPPAYPGMHFFLLFLAAGVVSAVWNSVPTLIVAQGAILASKCFLLGWSSAQFEWQDLDIRRLWHIGKIAFVVTAIGLALNLLLGSSWVQVFSVSGTDILRYGLPSLFSVYIHPFDLAFAASVFAIGAAARLRMVDKPGTLAASVLVSILGVVASLRRKDLIGLVVGLIRSTKGPSRSLLTVSIATAAILTATAYYSVVSSEIESFAGQYLTADSKEARTVLTLGAVSIANEGLPLGAGFGRYGSRTAAVSYSPEYSRLGLDRVYGLGQGPDNGFFLTDTSWPAILGETGYIGIAFFLGGLFSMYRFLGRLQRQTQGRDWLGWLSAATAGWFILVLVESLGAPVFTSPPVYPLVFVAVGVAASLGSRPGQPAHSETQANSQATN